MAVAERPKLAVPAFLTLVGLGGYALFYWLLVPPPAVLTTVTLLTERIRFVAMGKQSAFYVQDIKDSETGSCLRGLVTPTRGASVSYARRGQGPFEIQITSPSPSGGLFEQPVQPPQAKSAAKILGSSTYFESCDTGGGHFAPMRLPIWGAVTVGEEFRPDADPMDSTPRFLLSGQIKAFAQAITWMGLPPTPYPVADVSIPVGASLTAEKDEKEGAVWWGIATVDPGQAAISVSLATTEDSLTVRSPRQQKPDRIRVSTLFQITNDPNLLRLQGVLVVGILMIGFFLTHRDPFHHVLYVWLASPVLRGIRQWYSNAFRKPDGDKAATHPNAPSSDP